MDSELESFIKVWLLATTSLGYCYYIPSKIPKGLLRLLSLVPIFFLFLFLPLHLSSFHLGGPTAFFLVWLATFKLLLFSFDLGPLSPPPPNLLHFISIACLPIKIKPNPPPKLESYPNPPPKLESNPNPPPKLKLNPNPPPNLESNLNSPSETVVKPLNTHKKLGSNPNPQPQISNEQGFWSILLAVKALLLALIIRTYDYKPYLDPTIVLALYCCHMYLALEIVLALAAAPARALFGFELDPQFNEPYLSTSLQDFWGRRWNLVVTSILRPTVYDPVRQAVIGILGRRWASLPAIVLTFTVSGLMHEVIYYYLTRVQPTWEVTWFFVLHGVCVAAEVAVKRELTDRWRLRRTVSGALTIGWLAVTGNWLFFPQLMRNGVDEKAIREYSIFVHFVKDCVSIW